MKLKEGELLGQKFLTGRTLHIFCRGQRLEATKTIMTKKREKRDENINKRERKIK